MWRRLYHSVDLALIVLKSAFSSVLLVAGHAYALIRLVRQFFGFPAVGRVELDFKAQPDLRPEPRLLMPLYWSFAHRFFNFGVRSPRPSDSNSAGTPSVYCASLYASVNRTASGTSAAACRGARSGWYRSCSAIFSFRRSAPLSMCSRPAKCRSGSAASICRIVGSDGAFALVLDVRAGLRGFGVLVGGESAGVAARPGAVGVRLGSKPLPFWIALLVFFPGGPQ